MARRDVLSLHLEDKDGVLGDATATNQQRLALVAGFAAVLDAAYFLWFLFVPEGTDPVRIAWHRGIQATHFVSLLAMLAFLAAALVLRRKPRPRAVLLAVELPFLAALVALGASLTRFDQLVTTNITPFLLVCVVLGAAFFHRPIPSALVFLAAFGAFAIALGAARSSPDAFLSNLVNGVSACVLGFGISFAFWRTFLTNRSQKVRIEAQRQELARVNGELEHLAFHDALTGLPNRRLFDRTVRAESAAARRRGTPTSLIVVDLDHFKELNDTHGHPVGDEVLRQCGALLAGGVRISDTVARLGGEEFILLLPDTPVDGAAVLAEKLRGWIEATAFATESGTVRMTASFGVAELTTKEGQDPVQGYAAADDALYRAKSRGRNRVETA